MAYLDDKKVLSEALARAIERDTGRVEAICREIHEHPEPAFSEQRASELIAGYLRDLGYEVETGIAGMPTAFIARMHNHDTEAMRKGLRHGHVAFLAEYDAGEQGHLHGRPLVAGGAMLAAAGMAEVLKGLYGDVSIIGCPAASTLEGKRLLAEAGIFEAPDLAIGIAPASSGMGFQPTITQAGNTLASAHLVATFAGEAGESDARQRLATAAQSLEPGDGQTLQASLSERGLEFVLTAPTTAGVDELTGRIRDLASDISRDTGATVIVETASTVPAMAVSRILARRIKTYSDNMGLAQDAISKSPPGPPSDWAYPSLVTSTVIARFPVVESGEVVEGTPEFAEATMSEYAFKQLVSVSLGVCITAMDALGDMDFRGFVEGELIRSLKTQGLSRTPRRWLGVHPVLPRADGNGNKPPALGKLSPPRRR